MAAIKLMLAKDINDYEAPRHPVFLHFRDRATMSND